MLVFLAWKIILVNAKFREEGLECADLANEGKRDEQNVKTS